MLGEVLNRCVKDNLWTKTIWLAFTGWLNFDLQVGKDTWLRTVKPLEVVYKFKDVKY
jgi:hypothetical protein